MYLLQTYLNSLVRFANSVIVVNVCFETAIPTIYNACNNTTYRGIVPAISRKEPVCQCLMLTA